MPDPLKVNAMFSRIADRYDLANKLLSAGTDIWWRQKLVRAVHDARPSTILDLATGSGDVAFALADGLPQTVKIVGMDFCQPMLDEAVKKQALSARWATIDFRQGDGLALPLPDQSADAATISFGLRNMANRQVCLKELRRILRPSGKLFVLEFSQPVWWLKPFYYTYLKFILPTFAGFVTGDKSAYEYLCGSIEEFPGRDALSAEISRAGFSSVSAKPLTFGIVALHEASR